MRVVVLGANGQLGMPILQRLLHDYPSAQVVGCIRLESFSAVKESQMVMRSLVPFNPFKDDWARLGRVDVLINCIGIIRETATLDFAAAHLGLTRLMLQHRAQLGNPKLIQVSALGAATDSPSRFLQTKTMADEELLRHAHTVIIRPSIVCTPGTMLSQKLQLLKRLCRFTGGVLPVPAHMLQTKLQPVGIDDLAELVSLLCTRQNHPALVEIGGKEVYTLAQLLRLVPTCRCLLPFPQLLYDKLYPVANWLLPNLLDREQQVLLQQDNVADTSACEFLLGRPLQSTAGFWEAELA